MPFLGSADPTTQGCFQTDPRRDGGQNRLDHPERSLRWEQGICVWSAVPALWNYRCGVRYGRAEPTKETSNAFWVAEFGHWGRGEPVSISPRSAQQVRQVIRLWIVHRRKAVPVAHPPVRIAGHAKQKGRTAGTHRAAYTEGAGRVQTGRGAVPRSPKGVDGWITTVKTGTGPSMYRHVLNHCAALPGLVQTTNRAEPQACIPALRVTARAAVTVCGPTTGDGWVYYSSQVGSGGSGKRSRARRSPIRTCGRACTFSS